MIRDLYIKANAPSSGGVNRSTAKLMRTGQTISYQTGDDVSLITEGRDSDFLTLDTAPLHNDGTATLNTTTNRLTDTLGGQTYANNIILDWSTWDGAKLIGWYKTDFSTLVLETWGNANTNSAALSVAGFTPWKIPNRNELLSIMRNDSGNVFNYAPFSNTSLTVVWTSSTVPEGTSSAHVRSGSGLIPRGKTSTSYSTRCRTFLLSTLNVLT